MPDINIDYFKSRFQGGMRQYMFYFKPQFPDGGSMEDAIYLVRTTTAPENTIEEVTANWQGYDVKVAGRSTFPDFTVTFNADNDANIMKRFYRWMEAAHDPVTNQHAVVLADYMMDQTLEMLGLDGTVRLTYKLYNAWPKTVSGPSLDYSSNDLVQFDVTFAYTHHEILEV